MCFILPHVIKTYPALCSPSTVYLSATWYAGIRLITDLAGAPGLPLYDWDLHCLCLLHTKTPWQSKCLSHHFRVRHLLAFTFTVFLAQYFLPPDFLRLSYFSKLISCQIYSTKSFLTIGDRNSFTFIDQWCNMLLVPSSLGLRSENLNLRFKFGTE